MKAIRFVPALLWMIVIFVLSSIPNLELSGQLSTYDYLLRKLAHIVEYIILNLLIIYGLNRQPTLTKSIFFATVISILYAISDEIHQSFVPTRSSKITDVIIDATAIIISSILIKLTYVYQNFRLNRSNPRSR